MPPKNSRKRTSESYESDNGFIADAPKTKKPKATASSKTSANTPLNGKKGKSGSAVDAKGEEFWEISNNRRVTISEFSSKKMVNIREYYEKDGESLPGKKGISMPIEQFSALITLLPSIETVLLAQGIEVPRPDYGVVKEGVGAEDKGNEDIEEEDEGGDEGGKKNFEQTSEEEG